MYNLTEQPTEYRAYNFTTYEGGVSKGSSNLTQLSQYLHVLEWDKSSR